MWVCTRVSYLGLWVFGGRHRNEHHWDIIWRLLFAQSKEIIHPKNGKYMCVNFFSERLY